MVENLQNQPVIRTSNGKSELERLQDLQSSLHGSVDKRTEFSGCQSDNGCCV